MTAGAGLALLSALCFGVTTPLVQRAGAGLGPLATASLLYVGAALSAGLLRLLSSLVPEAVPGGVPRGSEPSGSLAASRGAPTRPRHAARIAVVALLGAGLAPVLFVWGLQRAGGATGSLLLNLEAVFTVAFAWAIHREPIGRRVAVAVSVMALAGVALAVGPGATGPASALSAIAIAGATAAWALDNVLSRPLAEHDPVTIVAGKGTLGALVTLALAFALSEPVPTAGAALALLACGATGYGLSLRLYLLAQRRIGAARTGSIFAVAPFVGAGVALLLGDRAASGWTAAAAALFAAGVYLHVTESHEHRHAHAATQHEHVHRHDDGHHVHTHEPGVAGEHSHAHRHDALEHAHPHAPDYHHDHAHE